MKKRIMFIIWALEVGGAERLLVKLIQNIPSDFFDVQLVCIARKGVWAKELEEKGISVINMDKKVGFDPFILFRLIKVIKEFKPDIVNTHLWTADLWGRLAAILSGVDHIVVTEQNVDVWKKWYHKLIDRLLSIRTDYFICVSNQVVDFYHDVMGIPLRKIKMIPNAIDLNLFEKQHNQISIRDEYNIASDEILFVCAARLHPQKAHHILIEAADKLVEQGNQSFKLLIIGEGELRGNLEKIVEQKSLQGYIFFLGLRQDIPQILLESDCFVLSSDYEGLPLAILEAMAAGLPIVATEVGGNPEVIYNGETGYLVPAQDPIAFADSMKKIIYDLKSANQMGEKGKKVIKEKFSIEKITIQTINLFNSLY